jgi:hypothetical protein
MNFRKSVLEEVIEKGLIKYGKFTYENVYSIKNFERALKEATRVRPLRERKNIKGLKHEEILKSAFSVYNSVVQQVLLHSWSAL